MLQENTRTLGELGSTVLIKKSYQYTGPRITRINKINAK
jgi:hypothetical protein